MNKNLKKVLEWQKLFGQGGRHIVSEYPKIIEQDLAEIRVSFLAEEIEEYLTANRSSNMVDVIDALVDLVYFIDGMIVIHGLQGIFDEAFDIVHQSNMSKLGDNGKPILREDGKILKGNNYWEPTGRLRKLLDGEISPLRS